jgi:hypothetical protein
MKKEVTRLPFFVEYIKKMFPMRAKTVNEAQDFERGRNPKATLGVGGIDLASNYEMRIDDYKKAVQMVTMEHTEDWKEFLRKTLVGKTITAEMKQLPQITKSGKSKPSSGMWKLKETTIQVQDIIPTWGVGEDFSITTSGSPMGNMLPKLILADMKNNMYELSMDQKIYID